MVPSMGNAWVCQRSLVSVGVHESGQDPLPTTKEHLVCSVFYGTHWGDI